MFTKKLSLFCAGLISTFSIVHAGPVERYMQLQLEANTPLVATPNLHQAYFKQLIDHNNPAAGTFAQRYYLDETYGPANDAPVFFYICGESACTERALMARLGIMQRNLMRN